MAREALEDEREGRTTDITIANEFIFYRNLRGEQHADMFIVAGL